MKNLIFVAFLFMGFSSLKAQTATPYLNTPYSKENVTNIKDQVSVILGPRYCLDKISYALDRPQARIEFSNGDSTIAFVKVNKGLVKSLPVIDNLIITAPFEDVFKVYERLFKTEVNLDVLRKRGYAVPITYTENGQHIAIAFVRNSSDGRYWNLLIRKV